MSGCGECNACPKSKECTIKNADYTIALAGNANVGKSVIFNQLTGVPGNMASLPPQATRVISPSSGVTDIIL